MDNEPGEQDSNHELEFHLQANDVPEIDGHAEFEIKTEDNHTVLVKAEEPSDWTAQTQWFQDLLNIPLPSKVTVKEEQTNDEDADEGWMQDLLDEAMPTLTQQRRPHQPLPLLSTNSMVQQIEELMPSLPTGQVQSRDHTASAHQHLTLRNLQELVSTETKANDDLFLTERNYDDSVATIEVSSINSDKPHDWTLTPPEREQVNTAEWGNMNASIQENRHCKLSLYTGYHIRRKTGIMRIEVTTSNANGLGTLSLRCQLERRNRDLDRHPIQEICPKHQMDSQRNRMAHVLQAAVSETEPHKYETTEGRSSIVYIMRTEDDGTAWARPSLRVLCNDTCLKTQMTNFVPREDNREIWLVLKIETTEPQMVIARKNIPIWVKSQIVKADLQRQERKKHRPSKYEAYIPQSMRRLRREVDPRIAEELERLDSHGTKFVKQALELGISSHTLIMKIKHKYRQLEALKHKDHCCIQHSSQIPSTNSRASHDHQR